MKKYLASFAAIIAIAFIALGFHASAADNGVTDLSNVKVTAYKGTTTLISMSGADCASVFYVLPLDVRTRIADEWDNFRGTGRKQGTCAGVRYSFGKDVTLEYNGYKLVATNMTQEMISRIVSKVE